MTNDERACFNLFLTALIGRIKEFQSKSYKKECEDIKAAAIADKKKAIRLRLKKFNKKI